MKLFCLLILVSLTVTKAMPSAKGSATQAPFLTTLSPTEGKSRFAMLDDVRLLANGLLQLGQSLREFVHKTKAQINDILQKLNIFDRSFYQLSVVTNEIKEEEEELKRTTTFLKANNEEIRNLSLEINSKINSILQERTQLQSKVGGLEERLRGLSESMVPVEQLQEISSLKEVIESQERTITDLLKSVREQHEQLNYQKIKIKSLEEKLIYETFQDTLEKPTDSNADTTHILGYLTSNETDISMDTNDLPLDCSGLIDRGQKNSGIYTIKPNNSEPFYVYCEMTSDGAATVIQRRLDGSVDFDQTWDKYTKGFGDLEKEFWLGLEKIYAISRQGEYILHIQLEDWREERRFVEYTFTLDGPSSDYTLHLAHLSGNLPDIMGNHTGVRFSTKDNDVHEVSTCTRNYTGGWWFGACGDANLNGSYMWLRSRNHSLRRKGIYWRSERGISYTLKSTKISIRPTFHFQ
ncbi:angiopoietin-related protein 3 [Chanos chanos]|uniref:Angiopoietin-related protein 3 n=1 Tax=Chanos chanos TaxID=29144 RepID=A0A6J2WTG9_CHACN|nr:angiopoietin-related protein 3 [Chanos chanos]